MSDKVSRLFKSIEQYMPYLIKDEMQKREVMRWLEKSLKEQAAYGEEQRKTIEASSKAQEREAYINAILKYFEERNLPEVAALQFIQQSGLGSPGVTLPVSANQDLEKAITNSGRAEMYRQAGEIAPEELMQSISRYQGPKSATGLSQDIVKLIEAEKERKIRGREVGVQEALVPVKKGELSVRLKEQVGDMTPKEAEAALAKLGVERRRYQEMLETKTNEFGDLLKEKGTNQIKKNIEEIEKLEMELNQKLGKKETQAEATAPKITATNPKTGQRIYWDEKLKKWTSMK